MADALNNKVALITGASSGIGEATAIALAKQGAKIGLFARRAERLEQVQKELQSKFKKESMVIVADVADPIAVAKGVADLEEKFGRIDILVNNAGVMYLGSVAGADAADWRRMMDINVMGLMYCTHAVLPIMKKNGGGDVVNISSVSGRIVSARSAVYSATKFAVNAFSEGLRQEVYKDKIRIITVEPGAVLTELTDHIKDTGTKEATKSWVSTMTALNSEDIANAIAYAVSQPWHVSVNEILIRPTDQAF